MGCFVGIFLRVKRDRGWESRENERVFFGRFFVVFLCIFFCVFDDLHRVGRGRTWREMLLKVACKKIMSRGKTREKE